MSRTASTIDNTALITRALKGSNLKSIAFLEYWNNNQWNLLEDLDESRGISWEKSAKNYKYASFPLVPLSSKYSFTVNSPDGIYSEGSGDAVAGVLDLNTKMRLSAGYQVNGLEGNLINADLNAGYGFYTTLTGGEWVLSPSNIDGNPDIYLPDTFSPYYDSETYDDSTYSADAYFFLSIDNSGSDPEESQVQITANNSLGKIYYRTYDNGETPPAWTFSATTQPGPVTIIIPDSQATAIIDIIIVYDGIDWAQDYRITGVAYTNKNAQEIIYRDVFFLDTPTFNEPSVPVMPTVKCQGRDIWKNAIEKDINLGSLSGGVPLTTLIKDMADKIGIPYSATSIADLSAFTDRTLADGLGKVEKASKVFDYIMQIINQKGAQKYQMYIEYDSVLDNNILFVQLRPTDYEADFVFNYKDYLSIGSRRKNYDKLLQRLSVSNTSETVDEEVNLTSDSISTPGTHVLSWSGESFYKRYSIDYKSSSADTVATVTETNPENMTFSVSGTTIDIEIDVFGDKWRATAPTAQGESIVSSNMEMDQGITNKIINPLILDDTEARNVADGFAQTFGSPVYEANAVKWPYLNLIPEINDMVLMWSRYTYMSDLYPITGINYSWNNGSNPTSSTSFNLDDSGQNFSDINPDGFAYDTILLYNIGYLYDMSLGPGATEDDVDTSKYYSNVGAP